MTDCPYCQHENIEGADNCAECGQPLMHTHLTPPANPVERTLLRDRIEVLSPHTPVITSPTTPVGEVLKQMVAQKIGCVMVAESDRLVGIFSERDALLKLNTAAAGLATRPVSEFMTSDPQTLVASAKLAFAVARMDLGGYRHLPIVGPGGELVGVISARDILRHLTETLAQDAG